MASEAESFVHVECLPCFDPVGDRNVDIVRVGASPDRMPDVWMRVEDCIADTNGTMEVSPRIGKAAPSPLEITCTFPEGEGESFAADIRGESKMRVKVNTEFDSMLDEVTVRCSPQQQRAFVEQLQTSGWGYGQIPSFSVPRTGNVVFLMGKEQTQEFLPRLETLVAKTCAA